MNNLPNITEILINTFRTIINQSVEFVPKFMSALVVMGVGILVARTAGLVIRKVLERVGLDRIGAKLNEIDFIRQLQTEIKLSSIMAQIVYYFVLLVFIQEATKTLGVAAISDMVRSLVEFIPRLIAAAIMLQVGVLLADVLRKAVVGLCESFGIASGKLLGMVVFSFFLVVTIISALGQAGINTELLESSFNLIIGGVIFAFAAGYGLASRDVMANLLSSFYSKSRFKEGQTIRIDTVQGTIIKLDATSMTLQTGATTTIIPLQSLQSKNVELFD